MKLFPFKMASRIFTQNVVEATLKTPKKKKTTCHMSRLTDELYNHFTEIVDVQFTGNKWVVNGDPPYYHKIQYLRLILIVTRRICA